MVSILKPNDRILLQESSDIVRKGFAKTSTIAAIVYVYLF